MHACRATDLRTRENQINGTVHNDFPWKVGFKMASEGTWMYQLAARSGQERTGWGCLPQPSVLLCLHKLNTLLKMFKNLTTPQTIYSARADTMTKLFNLIALTGCLN